MMEASMPAATTNSTPFPRRFFQEFKCMWRRDRGVRQETKDLLEISLVSQTLPQQDGHARARMAKRVDGTLPWQPRKKLEKLELV